MSRLVLTKIDLASDKFFPRDVLTSWMTTGSRYSWFSRLWHCTAYMCEVCSRHDSVLTYLAVFADQTCNTNPVSEPVPRSLHNSQLRLFSLNRVRTALRGASMANRRLRDSASTTASMGATPSDYAQSEEWCIEMLLTQINGNDSAVARAALSVLEEATQDERCLRTLVNLCLPNSK